jgi:glutamine amidotransferase
MIWGNTDTEHLAALYFTYLGDIQKQYSAREMRNALAKAIRDVQEIQVRVLGQNTPNNMNICISVFPLFCNYSYRSPNNTFPADGESLVALRWRNRSFTGLGVVEHPPSLYVSYNAAASFNRKHKHHPWVTNVTECTPEELTKNAKPASEQLQSLEWNPHGPHVIVASEPASKFLKNSLRTKEL